MTAINTTSPPRRMTLEEYTARPQGSPKCEFENGVLIPVTQPTPQHQDVLGVLWYALRAHVRRHQLGRVFLEPDVLLPDGEGYIPDIAFLSQANMRHFHETDQWIHGAPDLVVEIVSSRPSRDRVDKFVIYFQNKVPWCWLIDPETLAIEENQATDAGYLRTASIGSGREFKPKLFPGLSLNLATLLDPTPPT